MHFHPATLAFLCSSLLVLGSSFALPAFAAPVNGIPLCSATGSQLLPVMVSDGAGGAIVAWHDNRAAGGGVCYAQRVDANGTPLWSANGIPLSTTGDPGTPAIASDGAGGAFVVFAGQGTNPHVQWVNAAGAVQWGVDGIAIATTTTTRDLAITRDLNGGGGCIVVWREDNGAAGSSDIIGQRVNSSGNLQWGAAGKVVSSNMNNENVPAVVSDNAGGCWVAWVDAGSGPKIIRLDSNGNGITNRIPLGPTSSNRVPNVIADGASGVVVAWTGSGAFTQRLSSAGDKLWGNSGVTLSLSGGRPTLMADGGGGAIITWEDNGSGNFNVYAQHVNGAGASQWTAGGVEVSFESDAQRSPVIVSDGGAGALVAWQDSRSGSSLADIYAQRIDGNGAQQWTTNGVGLCTASGSQETPVIATDGSGGAWVAWQDGRNGAGSEDIYILRVNPSGTVLAVTPDSRIALDARVLPNPFASRVEIRFTLASSAAVRLEVFDVHGRTLLRSEATTLAGGRHSLAWDGRTDAGVPAGEGLYFLRVTGPGIAISRSVVRLK